jgi:hypothetical protein
MKPAIATVLLVLGVAVNLVAQSAFKDTIYLKDKSYYFGFITEINMRDSIRILSPTGNNFAIAMGDIERVHLNKPSDSRRRWPLPPAYVDTFLVSKRYMGYLWQATVSTYYLSAAIHMTFGYKFNPHLHLGILTGFELMSKPTAFLNRIPEKALHDDVTMYWPLALHIGGDFSTKHITPYYQVRIGAAIATNTRSSSNFNDSALDIGANFGIKTYSLGRKYFTFGATACVKHYTIKYVSGKVNEHLKWQNTPATALFFGMYVGFGI